MNHTCCLQRRWFSVCINLFSPQFLYQLVEYLKLKPDGLIFYLRESCPNPSMAGELVPVPTLASVTCPRCHKHHFISCLWDS